MNSKWKSFWKGWHDVVSVRLLFTYQHNGVWKRWKEQYEIKSPQKVLLDSLYFFLWFLFTLRIIQWWKLFLCWLLLSFLLVCLFAFLRYYSFQLHKLNLIDSTIRFWRTLHYFDCACVQLLIHQPSVWRWNRWFRKDRSQFFV